MKFAEKIIVGIDEAGRGPLAGPVTVGVFAAPENLKRKLVRILGGKIKDSKQLSTSKRESIFAQLQKLKLAEEIDWNVAHSSAKMIDRIGITKAIQKGIDQCLKYLTPLASRGPSPINRRGGEKYKDAPCTLRLDGLLKAPSEYRNQKTIIGGDAKDVFIACASIVAKVSRDRLMTRLAKKYPKYGFEIHKGYGTLLHRKFIKKHGLSALHRLSFCSKMRSW